MQPDQETPKNKEFKTRVDIHTQDKAEKIAAHIDLLAAIHGPPRATPTQRKAAQDKIKAFNDFGQLSKYANI